MEFVAHPMAGSADWQAPRALTQGSLPRAPVAADVEVVQQRPPAGRIEAGSGFNFWDMLDIVNPLQHIPLVNLVYREISGDEIGPVARIAGGTLFGGVPGLVYNVIDAGVEWASGATMSEHVMALIDGDGAADEPVVSVASVASVTPPPAESPPETTRRRQAPGFSLTEHAIEIGPARQQPDPPAREPTARDVYQALPEGLDARLILQLQALERLEQEKQAAGAE